MTIESLLSELLLRLAVQDGHLTDDGSFSDPVSQLRVEPGPGQPVTLNGRPVHEFYGLPPHALASMGVTTGEVAVALRVAGLSSPVESFDASPRERTLIALVVALAGRVLGAEEGTQCTPRGLPALDLSRDEQAARQDDERELAQLTEEVIAARNSAETLNARASKARVGGEETRARAFDATVTVERLQARIADIRARLATATDAA